MLNLCESPHFLKKNAECFIKFNRSSGVPNATLYDPATKSDIGKGLIQDGFIIVEKRPARRFAKIVSFILEVMKSTAL